MLQPSLLAELGPGGDMPEALTKTRTAFASWQEGQGLQGLVIGRRAVQTKPMSGRTVAEPRFVGPLCGSALAVGLGAFRKPTPSW